MPNSQALLTHHPSEEGGGMMCQGDFLGAPGAQRPNGGAHGHSEALSYCFHVDLRAFPGVHLLAGGPVPPAYLVGPSI